MSKLKLMLILGLMLGSGKIAQAGDFWQMAKDYVCENSRVLTAVGAAIYLLFPDEEPRSIDKKFMTNGVRVNNRSRQELAPLLAQQGVAALKQKKQSFKKQLKARSMPVIRE